MPRLAIPLDGKSLPNSIVQKINVVLGTAGQPHFAAIPHERLATGCVVWELQTLPTPTDPGQMPVDIQTMLARDIDAELAKVRGALANEEVIAYKSIDHWLGVYQTASRKIVVCPSTNQFDIIRFEQGPSPYSDSEHLIAKLKEYDAEYGIDITGAGYQVVEFSLKRIPIDQEAGKLSHRILDFAPDVVYETGEEIKLIDFSRSDGRVALWWD